MIHPHFGLWGELISHKGPRDKFLFTIIVPESYHFHFIFISFTLRRVLEDLVYHGGMGF